MIWAQVLYTHAVVLLLLIPFARPEPSFGSFTWKLATMCCKREISSLLLAGCSVLHWKWETEPCVLSQSGSVVLQFACHNIAQFRLDDSCLGIPSRGVCFEWKCDKLVQLLTIILTIYIPLPVSSFIYVSNLLQGEINAYTRNRDNSLKLVQVPN